MIINKVHIEKFRGFTDVTLSLGRFVTLIAGQNGTQKSTLLGLLTQPFTIPNKDHILSNKRPLTGGNYRSSFQHKLRLSPTLDLAGSHEWTLFLNDKTLHPNLNSDGGFTVESIPRDNQSIRIWQKGTRAVGSGYIQLPMIYLSLQRLTPLAEISNLKETTLELTIDDKAWFVKEYNKILISSDPIQSLNYLTATNKHTMGVSTDYYDWNSNSAGQDNIGRILLAIINFRKLKNEHPSEYKGAILAIDEIDATLYPGSQVKLLDSLQDICKELDLQIIATTHSLQLLERMEELQKSRNKLFKTIYLEKKDGKVIAQENPEYEKMLHNLNLSLGKKAKPPEKLPVFTEDGECIHFVKALLGRKVTNLIYPDISLGCGNLIQLGTKKVPGFTFPNSIVVLDGDAREKLKSKRLKNYLCLPGELNPEGMLATFLINLSDSHTFWSEINPHYSKQHCFKDYTFEEITSNRKVAKAWYKQQLGTECWGVNAKNLYKHFLQTIPDEHTQFIDNFKKIYSSITN
ncbi:MULTISPECIES: AAA family ATPase [Vibrio]|uniref:AAA family ATPase n=1 Tax=Vibrio TaxID=662 RepID=UPI000C82FAED|nr:MULTISPECIES: AAA family ATPase [Vibrio]PMN08322.1 hypothetical protein BCT39_14360 [Vibrio lentus]PTO70118.1 hypothetical protein CWN96_04285 [Vibrio splendidus]